MSHDVCRVTSFKLQKFSRQKCCSYFYILLRCYLPRVHRKLVLLLLLLLLPKHLYSAPRRTERLTKEKNEKIENKNYGNK